jgi:hypothetical protein
MPAGERYLLLADISGYTGFMAGVEQDHGVGQGSALSPQETERS